VADRRPVRTRTRSPSDDEEYDRLEDEPEEEEEEGNDTEIDDGRSRRHGRDGDARERSRPLVRHRDDPALTAGKAARLGLRQIEELTGKPTEGVTWVERCGDDGWTVGVEVVEDRRIPSAADILAIYDTAMDPGGELLSYRRVRRYSRGRGDDGNGG
jgi:hypothetical protein